MSAQPLTDASVTELVRAATAAPSLDNAQPWRFVYRTAERLFEVHHAPERAMPHLDPDARAQHLGCGAALFNLRVALAHAGWETATTLLPGPLDAHPLATVRALDPAPATGALAALHPAIGRRRSSRAPFSAEPVPEDVRAGPREAARAEGARLLFPDAWHVETVLDLVRNAEEREAPYAADPDAADETARWTRVEGARAEVEGVPPHAFGPRKYDGRAPVRDFAGRREVPGRGAATFEAAPQLALLGRPTGCARARPWSGCCSGLPSTAWPPRWPRTHWSGPTCAGPRAIRCPPRARCTWCCGWATARPARARPGARWPRCSPACPEPRPGAARAAGRGRPAPTPAAHRQPAAAAAVSHPAPPLPGAAGPGSASPR